MNQLCVPIPSASDTHTILDEALTLCRIPWIHDFIFRADPAADISMLLAPIQKHHALSARILISAVETSSRYAHVFDFSKDLLFYSLPAFSIGSITAGLCVEQPSPNASPVCLRFVRDDQMGVFLHVSENHQTGVTEVDCLTHKSPTRRSRVRIKFDLHSLRNVLRTSKGILVPADIAASLIYLNVSDEKRACPVCNDPTATHCPCVLPFRRPNHPLDFQYEANNMGLYTGFYQGATVVRLCSAGHCVINATLQSSSLIQGDLNSDVTARLHRMAVQDRLSLIKQNPTAMAVPESALDVEAIMGADVIEEAQRLASRVQNTQIGDDYLVPNTPEEYAAPSDQVQRNSEEGKVVMLQLTAEGASEEGACASSSLSASREEGEKSASAEDSKEKEIEEKETVTAGEDSGIVLDKAEIRKQRNRAAAARSNLKRKLKNESVRRDLANLTQRAIRLRVKEMMLRDENTRLRNALRRAGMNR